MKWIKLFLLLSITSLTMSGCQTQTSTSTQTVSETIPTVTSTIITSTPSPQPIIAESANYLLTIEGNSSYEISDKLFGIFLEDINYAIDGGMYAEMIKNRSFEYGSMATDEGFHGWNMIGDIRATVLDGSDDTSYLNPSNPHYLRLCNESNAIGGISNHGFLNGMAIDKNSNYLLTVYMRGTIGQEITFSLQDDIGTIYSDLKVVTLADNSWKMYTITLSANETLSETVSLYITTTYGTVDFDMISLFPTETYKNRTNGIRKDIGEALEALQPKFLRFPGGCVVEGETLANAYDWKASIGYGQTFERNGITTTGDIAVRPLAENIWGDANSSSKHPYYMTYGIGFYEYFLLCEDLNCEPVPIVNAGMSCQIQGTRTIGTSAQVCDLDSLEMKQYIQDALDLVEFCKGDETTVYGAIRIAMGHSDPFPLNYLGIGNEQWGGTYFSHYEAFQSAFKEAAKKNPQLYGNIQLILANGPAATDRYAWNQIKTYGNDYADLVDEHYYMEPDWFLSNTNRYDSYQRDSISVFLGEFAAKSNTMKAALAEAAFMTGLERNGDIVKLAAYAPLFGNSVSYQWSPDLIWFKTNALWLSINYHVQSMFSNNVSHRVNESMLTKVSDTSNTAIYHVCGTNEDGDLVIKLVNTSSCEQQIQIQLNDLGNLSNQWELTLLAGKSEEDRNTILEPEKVAPLSMSLTLSDDNIYTAPKYSVSILVLKSFQYK